MLPMMSKKMEKGMGQGWMKKMSHESEPNMEMMSDKEYTVLNISRYPELKGVSDGAEVTGTWTGKVVKVNGDEVKIQYTDMSIETENAADRDLNQMMGGKKKMGNSDEGGDEDY